MKSAVCLEQLLNNLNYRWGTGVREPA